ncbi:MAG: hypothetical protein PHD61_12740 [Bacteroidales bacterium]|nr:hypothetical protein [Lentimicrobiaceae bacterium]MDD5696156.1 hypothetical protein [Bacteroidales bacterium]
MGYEYRCQKGESIDPPFYASDFPYPDSSVHNPGNARYSSLLLELTSNGVPGVLMSVYHPKDGLWTCARVRPIFTLFIPLRLTLTSFAAEDPVPEGIVRGYIDLYSNLQVLESTYYSGWDYFTADGGLIYNPADLNHFFRSLMNGEVLNASSLAEMLTWQKPKEPDPDFLFEIQVFIV